MINEVVMPMPLLIRLQTDFAMGWTGDNKYVNSYFTLYDI
jgi:hypothetical protein